MPINQDTLRIFLFYKNTNLVGDLNMFNVHNQRGSELRENIPKEDDF